MNLNSSVNRIGLMLCIAAPVLLLAIIFGGPQQWNLRAVKAHIAQITPQWDKFRSEHPSLQSIRLGAYTGGYGELLVYGEAPSEDECVILQKFLESTKPPQPIVFVINGRRWTANEKK